MRELNDIRAKEEKNAVDMPAIETIRAHKRNNSPKLFYA